MSKTTPYIQIQEYFARNHVEYDEIYHEKVASAIEFQKELGTQLEEQAKALLLRYKNGSESGFMVLTLQAQKQANLEMLKELLEVKSLKLAQMEQLEEVTGCKFGELPPLGSIFGIKLIMDRDLLERDKIYFNAGRLDRTFVVKPEDIKNLEDPILAKL